MKISNKDLGLIAAGVILGSTLTGTGLYFGIIRKYIPLKDLEKEVAALQHEKASLCRQIEMIQDSYPKIRKEHEDAVERYEKEITFYEDELQAAKNNLKRQNDIHEASQAYAVYSGDSNDSNDSNDSSVANDQDDELDEDPVDIGPEKVELNDDPRWNGILNEHEQAQYDAANGDEDVQKSVLEVIKERRYRESIDPNHAVYEITEDEFNDPPSFFTKEFYDYYIEDDVIADGLMMVEEPDTLIDTHILKKLQNKSETIVWCRNERLTTDYEITRHDGSYQHDVIGVPEDEVYHARIWNKDDENETTQS